MKKFLNSFDYDHDLIKHESSDEPSMTVPDMTMSLGEILKRYTRGGEVATFTPVYQDGDDFDENPDISKMDAMEKLEYASQIKQSIQDYQNRPEPDPVKPETPKEEPKKEEPPKEDPPKP